VSSLWSCSVISGTSARRSVHYLQFEEYEIDTNISISTKASQGPSTPLGFKKHLETSQGRFHPQTAQAGGTCSMECPPNVGAGRGEDAAPFSPVLMC